MYKRAIRDIVVSVFGIVGLAQITPVFAANSGNINFSAKLQSSTTVTIPNDPVVLALSPSGSGNFGSTSFDIVVSTNQPGYTITMDTSSTTLTSDTINPDTNDFFTIPTLERTANGYTAEDFTRNRWGIAIDNNNFNAVLTTDNIKDTDVTANNEITKIHLGANLDMMTATGSYQTTINFAVTTKVAPLDIGDLTYLQDFATLNPTDLESVKNSMAINRAYELQDNRDGTSYHISKLADGRIWFLDNLAIDLTDATVQSKLTSTTTNATTTSINYLINGNGTTNDLYAKTGVINGTPSDDWSQGGWNPIINMDSKNVTPDNSPENGRGNNKVGGYYNLCAASAGSYCPDDNYEGALPGNITEDICPAGWRMPIGGTTGEYANLANAIYGSTGNTEDATAIANYRNALSLPLSGIINFGSAAGQGQDGFFLSSTPYGSILSTVQSQYMQINMTSIKTNDRFGRNYGYSVRCTIKDNSINELAYLQDFANLSSNAFTSVKNNMTTDTAYTLIDNRDGTSYHIAKLADGRIWLLDNLALDLTDSTVQSKLTPATTNATTTSISKLINGGGTTSDQYATAGVSNWTSSYSYSAPLINMASKDIVPNNAPTNGKGNNKVGGYYNFCAASAGSYCYGNGTSYGTSSGNATEDICPAGWRMPTGGATGDYAALANQIYGSTGNIDDATALANYRAALPVPLSGTFNNGSASSQGSGGYFWSSTRNNFRNMYDLRVNMSYVNPSDYYGRNLGYSVRCLVRNPDIIVNYSANGGTGTMSSQTITDAQVVAGTNQLTTNTFTRDGYQFTGWNTAADGSGTSYADGAIYTGSSTTLYAQWAAPIQSITTSNCPTTATAVYDTRDNTVYNIQKLADGRCWMLDNLALDLTDSTVQSKLTPETTNATATSINYLLNGGGTTSDQYATAGVSSNWTSSTGDSYSAPLINMASKNVVPANAPSGGKGYNKVGGYYNFCAASAGSYCYGNGTDKGTPSGNATEDICPAGWRMPTGDTTGEYSALANAIYGSTSATTDATAVANYRNALSLPRSGVFDRGSANVQGTGGDFWSSTHSPTNSDYSMYDLGVRTGAVYPSYPYNRNYGLSVRCLAK